MGSHTTNTIALHHALFYVFVLLSWW